MRVIILMVVSVVVMAGCAYNDFTSKQPDESSLPIEKTIRVVGFDKNRFDDVAGAAWYKARKDCEIIITKPISPDDTEAFCTIGHEFWHCLTGDFHDGYHARCGD